MTNTSVNKNSSPTYGAECKVEAPRWCGLHDRERVYPEVENCNSFTISALGQLGLNGTLPAKESSLSEAITIKNQKNLMTNKSESKNKKFRVWGVIIVHWLALMFVGQNATAVQAPVSPGSSAKFAVLAATTVTSSGVTKVNGLLGVSPGTAVTGSLRVSGMIHAGGRIAAKAQTDLTTAYNDAAGRKIDALTVEGNLGGLTLTPGLYKSTSSLEISSGDLTLDAKGDTNAVFIFQMGSTLTTTAARQVILRGGAQAANIYWQVGSSATLGTISVFKGNILALTSITLQNGAAVEGRLLARTAGVTLDSNTITLPAP